MEVLFHTFYCNFGRAEENRSLYRELRYCSLNRGSTVFNTRCTIYWKHDTLLAVYCTLLNNSYLGIYLQKTTTQKTGKKRKAGKKELSMTRPYTFGSTRLHLTTTAQRQIVCNRGVKSLI